MKIKLKDTVVQNKYDLYQVGNVIVDAEGSAFLVYVSDDNGFKNYGLIDLEDATETGGRRDSLKSLADIKWRIGDRLMVNPTLAEQGEEK